MEIFFEFAQSLASLDCLRSPPPVNACEFYPSIPSCNLGGSGPEWSTGGRYNTVAAALWTGLNDTAALMDQRPGYVIAWPDSSDAARSFHDIFVRGYTAF